MSTKNEKAYGEYISDMIDKTEHLYDFTGGMRDWATSDEKEYYNNLRGIYREASTQLRKLRDSLSKERYNSK